MKISKNTIIKALLFLMVTTTVFSQFKSDFQSVARMMMYLLWGLTFLYSLISNPKFYMTKFFKIFGISVLCIFLFGYGLSLFVNTDYNSLLMLEYMPIAFLAHFIGLLLYKYKDFKSLLNLTIWTYSIECTFLAIAIRLFNFSNISDWYSSAVYVYKDGKNQIGMVLTAAVILNLFYLLPKTKKNQ